MYSIFTCKLLKIIIISIQENRQYQASKVTGGEVPAFL